MILDPFIVTTPSEFLYEANDKMNTNIKDLRGNYLSFMYRRMLKHIIKETNKQRERKDRKEIKGRNEKKEMKRKKIKNERKERNEKESNRRKKKGKETKRRH